MLVGPRSSEKLVVKERGGDVSSTCLVVPDDEGLKIASTMSGASEVKRMILVT